MVLYSKSKSPWQVKTETVEEKKVVYSFLPLALFFFCCLLNKEWDIFILHWALKITWLAMGRPSYPKFSSWGFRWAVPTRVLEIPFLWHLWMYFFAVWRQTVEGPSFLPVPFCLLWQSDRPPWAPASGVLPSPACSFSVCRVNKDTLSPCSAFGQAQCATWKLLRHWKQRSL